MKRQTKAKPLILLMLLFLTLTGCAEKVKERKIVFPLPPNEPRLEWIGTFGNDRDFQRVGMDKVMSDVTGGGGGNRFEGPVGLAVGLDGRLLVNDLYAQTIKYLSFEEKKIGFFGDHRFRNNLGMATDEKGNVYVADGPARQVVVLSKEGFPLRVIGNKDLLEKPAYLAINDELGRLYVTDPKAYNVKVFSLDGEFLFDFGGKGGSESFFNVPQGIAIDREGKVFVADMLNARIQVFSAEGEYLSSFGSRGTLKSQFESPKDLSFDSDGNLYIVDSRRPSFSIYKADGTLLLVVGGNEKTSHKLGFALPVAIHVDQFDRVFISDLMNSRVAAWQYFSEAYQKRQDNPPK